MSDEQDRPEADSLLIALRAGYFLQAHADLDLWPRAGPTVLFIDSDFDQATTYALALELPLLFHLSNVLALSLTPHADLYIGESGVRLSGAGFSGSTETIQFGAQLGVTAFF